MRWVAHAYANSRHETVYPSASASRCHPPRLIERLNEGLHRNLILISAPAGFGKTTLVSEWVEGIERPTAWLSLDEGDNDPARFLTYLVAALQTIAATLGEGVLGVLQSPQPPPAASILTALLNDITTISDHFVLVLDDYHVIDAKPVDHALTFLLEHLPPHMHLVITTREDPQLPLARLRVGGHLTELRAVDLRFTPSEAAEFLNQGMGLNLEAQDIARLSTRTEGWIAGLQLAAISLQGMKTPPASSDLSPAATISCWTIWLKKSSGSSSNASRRSCCARPSSTACAARFVMPF